MASCIAWLATQLTALPGRLPSMAGCIAWLTARADGRVVRPVQEAAAGCVHVRAHAHPSRAALLRLTAVRSQGGHEEKFPRMTDADSNPSGCSLNRGTHASQDS
mmetsp:Transcript_37658/g.111403  ORF Transcript_37658/g.111403 Transcript_37658/m.111403 type:complete len:104 (-) Transcript_37658:856-1167(-)|eukprot:325593-Chlamydomonas_euryale.AAC.2